MPDKHKKKKPLAIPLPVLLASAFVLVFCLVFNHLVFERIPHVHDEIDYLFQARLFKSGRLYAPSPCASEAFDFPHMINNGRWYSQYTPGFPFLLLPGLLLNAPWAVNPLLAGLSVILIFLLGRELYDSKTGLIAGLLAAASTWFLVMSSTMMSHTASLFFMTLFLLFVFKSITAPTVLNGAAAGAALGMAILIRPFNAALFSLPFLAYYAFRFFQMKRARWKNLLAFGITVLIFTGLLLLYNQLTNGHPLRMGYILAYGEQVLPGFGSSPIPEIEQTPLRGMDNITEYLKALNSDVFGWPLSSFLALLPLLWLWFTDRKNRKTDFLFAAGFFCLLTGYFFYWGTFTLLGARLVFESLIVFILLSARGLIALTLLGQKITRSGRPRGLEMVAGGLLIVFFLYAFSIRLPGWLRPRDTEDTYKIVDGNFAGTSAAIHRSLSQLNLGRALIIMKFMNHPPAFFPTGGWGSGFLYNDPDLAADIIYAKDKGDKNIDLFSCFPERSFYLYLGTVKRGMLVPLRMEQEKIVCGKPLTSAAGAGRGVTLIDDPKVFFHIYSGEFERFLDRLYQGNRYIDIDVARLTKMGLSYRRNNQFREAAFCLEAALQVEKEPTYRSFLLNDLLSCYVKAGMADDAGRIMAAREGSRLETGKLYFILPEKGF
jgi:hypothetical protein